MNKEQEELLNDAYENYSKEYEKDNSIGMCLLVKRLDGKSTYRKPNKEMFVDLCTSDIKFSEKWGLKIEERELSLRERVDIFNSKMTKEEIRTQIATVGVNETYWEKCLNETKHNIPTKIITLEYNDTTIENYE